MPDFTNSKCFQPLALQNQDKCAHSIIPTGKVRLCIANMQKDYAMIKDAGEKNMTHDDSMLLQEDGRGMGARSGKKGTKL